jgi:iron complex outermembrane recepter protein
MKNILIIIALLTATFSQAQTRLILVDSRNQSPIDGAVVKTKNQGNFISDVNGEVNIPSLNVTEVLITHLAYKNLRAILQPNATQTFRLEASEQALSEIVVTGFESERPILKQAGAISRIPENEFYRFNEQSFVQAFNTKPGIRVEERAPASYRISIRGSSLRSPFGVRNVKVYWNEIPLTLPDGTTPLNLLDLTNVQDTEIIKGPAGSIYGAGNGGVVSFKSKQDILENRLSSDFSIGDFGFIRYRFGLEQRLQDGGLSVSYVRQQADGYREHSAMDRKVFQMALNKKFQEKQTIGLQVLYADLDYQIPGALTAAQVEQNPQQARPGSVRQNSSIAQKSLYGTITHHYRFSESLENHVSAYINTTDFENPFILDYKTETAFTYGGRTKFISKGNIGQFPVRLIAGAEYQYGKTLAQNFGNRDGKADTIRFSDDLVAVQSFLFQQIEWEWTKDILMTIGFSENFSRYDIHRRVDAGPNAPSNNQKRFVPIIVPRFAMAWQINSFSGIHGSISSGFSPPTIAEVRTNEGSINLDLEAERGVNYEIGYRSQWKIFNLDLTGFIFNLDQTITSYTNNQGVVLFRNAGATVQRGVEAQLDFVPYRNSKGFLQEIKFGHAFTGHYFKFSAYETGGRNYSGNALTGVAPNTLVNRMDVRVRAGFYLNVTHQYVDQIPLNDANTVFQEKYNLLSARVGWRYLIGRDWDAEVYVGGENLLDEQYSLGNDLNAGFGRFFQPAAGRNYYGGVKLGWRF